MKVARTDIVSMCEALGFATAAKWSKSRMVAKLKEIAETACNGMLPEIEDESLAEILKELCEANGECEVFQGAVPDDGDANATAVADEIAAVDAAAVDADAVDDADEAECKELNDDINRMAAGKPSKLKKDSKAVKPAKAAIKPAKPVKAKKPAKAKKEKKEVSKDSFGNRIGTNQAAFCAMLSDKPQTMNQLCERTGMKQQNGTFCRLVKEGKIRRTAEGYIL